MICPKCKNKDFQKSDDINKPLKVFRTEGFKDFNIRSLVCLQCGFRFKTVERYDLEFKISQSNEKTNSDLSLRE
jgi:transcriptional regulator NrdR family protein